MDALVGGQADVATTAISPVISASFQDQPMAILAENARFLEEKLTARVESGITEPADLAGKKIGVTMGSDVHYFLYLYLEYAGLTADDVDMVNLKPPDMVISLVRGDVDAFASWRPQPDNAKAEMGDGAIFLTQPDPPIFESLYLIVGMKELVDANPDAYERFMEAMVMADEFAASNPDETKACVAEVSEVDVDSAESLMAGYAFKIWLDQSMIEGSEKRATFQMENDLAPEGAAMPDFRKFIAEGPLEAVDPDRVSLE
jgi:NitT/TauT family transport system substrate-binding protein